ncbi:protein-tyrosine phosphatase-like protein [Melampsora americana]|nr:protein-tyrosine phosphatase-like protein [Melampsora americana]
MSSSPSSPSSSSTPINMNQIIPKLFIGDFNSSQSISTLKSNQIQNIVSAMKQSYELPDEFNLFKVPIDDTDKTNVSEWFDIVANWIQARLDDPNGFGVLVHCAAGVSRSTTLVAAYLMKAQKLTAEEAVFYISSKRPQVQPTEFFIYQLEMYERCDCEWNPAKYQEQRRFLMGFVANEMKDGPGAQKLVLAYYPSPAASPRDKNTSDPFSSFTMTPLNPERIATKLTSPSALTFELKPESNEVGSKPTQRQRLTKRGQSLSPNPIIESKQIPNPPQVEKLGKGEVTIKGKRIRCKMCRRELAARDHILSHLPGEGQAAFAPQKRDMTKFREEALKKFKSEQISSSDLSIKFSNESKVNEPLGGLASLRVSTPITSHPNSNPSNPSTDEFFKAVQTQALFSPPLINSTECSSYFVEPLSWMSSVLEKGELMGKLICPNSKCNSKLGSFDWAGLQCSCGAWITPGFQISRSKVDEI